MKDLKANTGQFLNVHSSKIGVNTDTPTSDLHVTGTAAVDGTLSVGDAVSFTDTGAVGGTTPTVVGQTIVWDGSKWIVGSSNSGGAEDTEVPAAFVAGLTTGQSVHTINFQQTYTAPPPVVTDLECGAGDPIIPYVITNVTTSNMTVEFAKALPSTGYKLHISFGGRDVFWTQGALSKLSYTDGDVSISNNLEVAGNLTISGETMTVNTTQMTIEDHNITIASTDTAAALTGAVKGDAGITWGNDNKVRLVYNSAKGFAFDGGDLNGNVGIGTTDPSYPLDVHGWINAQADALSTDAVINLAGSNNSNYSAVVRIKSTSESNLNGASSLTLSTRKDDDSINERMRITSSGNVGIGTTDPRHPFELFGKGQKLALTSDHPDGTRINHVELSSDGSGYGFMMVYNDVGNPQARVHSAGTSYFNGGNVGIGTVTPSTKLEILTNTAWGTPGDGSLRLSNHASGGDTSLEHVLGDIEWITQRNSENAQAAMIRVTRDKPTSGNGSSMRFFLNHGGSSSSTTERMRINRTGDVKLYKDTYSSLSSGAGNLTIETAGVARTAGEGPFINFRVPTDSTFAEDMANIGAVCSDSTASSRKADLVFWTRNETFGERMRITSDGKVGIGTGVGPTKALDVNGTMKTRGIMSGVTNDTQAWQAIRDGDATINLTDNGYNTSHAIGASLGSSTIASNNTGLYIGAYGVGSNTTNVHVKSGIHLDNHFTNNKGIRFFTGTGTTDIEERMCIKENGFVGVGTVAPTTNFDVAGRIGAKLGDLSNASTSWGNYIVSTSAGVADGPGQRQCLIGTWRPNTGVGYSGILRMDKQDGTNWWFWIDAAGSNLKTSTDQNVVGTGGGAVVGDQTSDERLKTIEPSFDYGLEHVLQLQPIAYHFKSDDQSTRKLGFGAQATQQVVPESVYDTGVCIDGYDKDPQDDMNQIARSDETTLGMQYVQLIPVLTKAIQEQQAIIDTQNQRIDTLEQRLQTLESK